MVKIRLIFVLAYFFLAAFVAQDVRAQGATTSAGNISSHEICVADPNAKLTPSVKPRKKIANVNRTAPVKARANRLAAARKKKPVDKTPVTDICPPGQKPLQVSFITPIAPPAPQPVMSLCQTAVSASANVTAGQVSSMLAAAGLDDRDYRTNGLVNASLINDRERLASAVAAAVRANPNAAPAILAYVVRSLNPQDIETLQAVTRAAYQAAPAQAAGLTYAAVAANKSQTLPITQAMLGAASPADDSVIRQCAIDANPDLANEIATAAFVPALSGPTSIGQNDIRNTINNPTGTTTIVPGLPNREVDNSAA